jgi:uncharacterized protein with HEPN domain
MHNPSMSPRDEEYLASIKETASEIQSWMQGFSLEAFLEDRLRCLAVAKLVEAIGEAAARLTKEARDNFPEVPWRYMSDTRNRLVHDYLHIDFELVYLIATQDIPMVISELNK